MFTGLKKYLLNLSTKFYLRVFDYIYSDSMPGILLPICFPYCVQYFNSFS